MTENPTGADPTVPPKPPETPPAEKPNPTSGGTAGPVTPGTRVERPDDHEPATAAAITQMLSYAWQRFNEYDGRSGRLKLSYRRLREVILSVTWITTFLAVLSAITEASQFLKAYFVITALLFLLFSLRWFFVYYRDKDTNRQPPSPYERLLPERPYRPVRDSSEEMAQYIPHITLPDSLAWLGRLLRDKYFYYGLGWLALAAYSLSIALNPTSARWLLAFQINVNHSELLRLTLVALPLLSAAMLAYATYFVSGREWVSIRVGAESIRRGIYTLRVMRWVYQDALTKGDLRDLDARINEAADGLAKAGVTTPNLTDTIDVEKVAQPNACAVDEPNHDDGYSPVSLAQYINWRLVPQTNWYRGRVDKDYHYTRVYRVAILGVGTLGAFLAAAGLGELVAVTVTLANSLNALLGLRQHEFTYSVYSSTIQRLETRYRDFAITFGMDNYKLPAASLSDKQREEIIRFVYDIEKAFDDERDLWKFSITQGQEVTEGLLAQMVNTYGSPDFDPERYVKPAADRPEAPEDEDIPPAEPPADNA